MDNQNSYSYIQIGLCLRLLANLTSKSSKKFAISELNKLKRKLQLVDFKVCCSNFDTSFFRDVESGLIALEENEPIGEEIRQSLNREMMILERHVLSESKTKKVHIFPERRFNSNYLLKNHKNLFKKGIFEKLPELAQFDIISSCKCILFGEGTAAAFHILRSTEGVLKNYYFHHKKQKRLKKPMWGPMITELRKKRRNKPPKTLLNSLDLIRESYRNPTQHPDATYGIEDAQDLFGLCLDVIGKMAIEL